MKIILKKETSLGLDSFDDLGFNSEEELEIEISKLIKIRPEFENNLNKICRVPHSQLFN